MSERIIIDFEDDERKKKNKPDDERIIIEFDKTEEKIEIDEIEESYERKILKSKINSSYRGNTGINNYFESDLKFPEGIEKGFRLKFSLNLEDDFYNSILENNRFIILSSGKGNIYLVDKFTGKINEKIFFENESFEKTGVVFENTIYLNSLKRIYELNKTGISKREIYYSEDKYYIWSSLNRLNDNLVFIKHNPAENYSAVTVIELMNNCNIKEFKFECRNYVSDSICIADRKAYVLFDGKILEYDFDKNSGEIYTLDIDTDESSLLFYSNRRLYVTTCLNELYYLDIPPMKYGFKYSGIKNVYINSAGGFEDNIFIGTMDGWKCYKTSGLLVFGFEDETENKIEALCKNMMIVSKKNKIVFCNLNRFQEAEGFVISSDKADDSVEIVSAVISGNEIAALTQSGHLYVYTNDKLNIHI